MIHEVVRDLRLNAKGGAGNEQRQGDYGEPCCQRDTPGEPGTGNP
jgi:hypothetical protein